MTKHVFMFPGQGAQYGGMGKDLAEQFPAARDVYERASTRLGIDLAKICFEGTDDDLLRTDIQQPAILVHSIAALEALRAMNGDDAKPAAVCGLSLGEYTAVVAAGAMDLEDAAYLVRKRGEYMQEACEAYPSTLASVLKLDRDAVEAICKQAAEETGEHCVLGNILSGKNITISGGAKAIARAVELAKEQRGRAMQLPVSGAFHSPYMKMAEEKLAEEIRNTPMRTPDVPIISNVDGKPTTDVNTIRGNLIKQLTSSVLWADSMEYLIDNGITEFTEVGPGRALSSTLKRTAKETKRDVNVKNYGTVKDMQELLSLADPATA